MKYEIVVRDDNFSMLIAGEYDDVLKAESAIRTLTEKALQIQKIKES